MNAPEPVFCYRTDCKRFVRYVLSNHPCHHKETLSPNLNQEALVELTNLLNSCTVGPKPQKMFETIKQQPLQLGQNCR